MVGYSGTPLAKKLGIKDRFQIALLGMPPGFLEELGPLPSDALIAPALKEPLDLILFFVTQKSELKKQFSRLGGRLSPAGMLWVAWPKKSSGVATDLSFAAVQKVGLEAGLVDTKICAVNEIWSGLKFVIRIKDRPKP